MAQKNNKSPVDELGSETGADVQFRFRFQATCAAIYSLLLLEDSPEVVELYCEQQEDILMKRKNDMYTAIQVKTRNQNLERFKATDKPMINSIKKFAKLESKYPNAFDSFMIVTNCGFWEVQDDHRNLPKMIDRAETFQDDDLLKREYQKVYEEIEPLISNSSDVHGFLAKIKCERISSLEEINNKLARAIFEMGDPYQCQNLEELDRIATRLVDEMVRAGTADPNLDTGLYDLILGMSEADRISRVVEGRKITKEIVTRTIQQEIHAIPILTSAGSISSNQVGRAESKFYEKIRRGKISEESSLHLWDQKASAENMLIELRNRRGRDFMDKIYQHLGMIVRDRWLIRFNEFKRTKKKVFGQELLEVLIPDIYSEFNELPHWNLPGLDKQHLMGIVGILTDRCPIKWSI